MIECLGKLINQSQPCRRPELLASLILQSTLLDLSLQDCSDSSQTGLKSLPGLVGSSELLYITQGIEHMSNRHLLSSLHTRDESQHLPYFTSLWRLSRLGALTNP